MALTPPDKVLFPDCGITKGELASYYADIAPLLLPHISERPVTLERYPAGITEKGFIQKDVVKGFPEWLQRVEVPKRRGTVRHALINDAAALEWMVNQNTVTPHVWASRVPGLQHPDLCVFDLDPASDDQSEELRRAALLLRDLLAERGKRSWIKTSGSKGFHIVSRLDEQTGWSAAARFANIVARQVVDSDPQHLTQEFAKIDRAGRIYVDTARTRRGATFAVVYAVRAKPGAPVSAPCTWDEVAAGSVQPRSFTLRTMAARVAQVGDLWSELR